MTTQGDRPSVAELVLSSYLGTLRDEAFTDLSHMDYLGHHRPERGYEVGIGVWFQYCFFQSAGSYCFGGPCAFGVEFASFQHRLLLGRCSAQRVGAMSVGFELGLPARLFIGFWVWVWFLVWISHLAFGFESPASAEHATGQHVC
jgi:hypothetical protein